jgi:hypothetical protein
MTTRLFRQRVRRMIDARTLARFSYLSTLVLLLCVLFLTGCGTSRESVNSYTRTSTAADEAGAAQTLRTISAAQMSFFAGHGEYGSFEDLTGGGLLDNRFAGHTPEVGGYVYTIKLAPSSGGEPSMFAAYADPKASASGGAAPSAARHLYMDSTNSVIHANPSQQAKASDPAFP